MVENTKEHILSKKIIKKGGCWLWPGCVGSDGYGHVRWNKKTCLAHRVFYSILVGSIPEGMTLDHMCMNKLCVNPSHLRPMTLAENVMLGNGACAVNYRKTHCVRGHKFSEENIYRRPGCKSRYCRKCKKIRDAQKR